MYYQRLEIFFVKILSLKIFLSSSFFYLVEFFKICKIHERKFFDFWIEEVALFFYSTILVFFNPDNSW